MISYGKFIKDCDYCYSNEAEGVPTCLVPSHPRPLPFKILHHASAVPRKKKKLGTHSAPAHVWVSVYPNTGNKMTNSRPGIDWFSVTWERPTNEHHRRIFMQFPEVNLHNLYARLMGKELNGIHIVSNIVQPRSRVT
jgi:hypothetical protein